MRAIRLPALQNVASGSKVSLRLPLGYTYQKIYLLLAGTGIAKANITNIVLRLNNKEFQRWNDAATLDVLNAYKGNAINAGYLVLDFTERKAREEIAMTMGTIAATNEAGVQDFTLEFDLGTVTLTAQPVAYADIESPSANAIIQRVMVQQKTLAAAAEEQVYLPYGVNGFQVKRLIVKHTNLTEARVRRDGVEVYESLPVAFANFREQDYGMVPQAGFHIIDFMPDVLQSNALNTAMTVIGGKAVPVANLDLRLKTSAADTLTIYAEGYALNGQL